MYGPHINPSKEPKKAFGTFIKKYDIDLENRPEKETTPPKANKKANLNWQNKNKLDEYLIDDQLIPKERKYLATEPESQKIWSTLIGLAVGCFITVVIVRFFFVNYLGHSLY